MRNLRNCILALSLAVFAVACASNPAYERHLQKWIGVPERHLVSDWGLPDAVSEVGGSRYLTFVKSQSKWVPGNRSYTEKYGGNAGFTLQEFCKTTFMIRYGIVQSWRWEGSICHA